MLNFRNPTQPSGMLENMLDISRMLKCLVSFKEPVLLDLRPALLHERDRLCSKTRLEVDDIVVKPYIERNIINACHGMGDMESSP